MMELTTTTIFPRLSGGLFKDFKGNFLLAFADSVPWSSSYLAEFVVVIRAMEISRERWEQALDRDAFAFGGSSFLKAFISLVADQR